MFKNLTYAYKNKMLIAASVLLLLLCWFLAFQKTFRAITINRQLNQASIEKNDLAYNPVYLNNKLNALNNVLNRYQVDSADWKNEFWLNVSSIAAKKRLEVIYQPELNKLSSDTMQAGLNQSIQFRGEFKGLVQLLDSLEHTIATGRIVSASMRKEKSNSTDKGTEKIILRTDFKAIQRR